MESRGYKQSKHRSSGFALTEGLDRPVRGTLEGRDSVLVDAVDIRALSLSVARISSQIVFTALALCWLTFLSGCSSSVSDQGGVNNQRPSILDDGPREDGGASLHSAAPHSVPVEGSVTIARPMPAAVTVSPADAPRLLGFLPTQFAVAGDWLRIDRSKNQATLMTGASEKLSVPIEGAAHLKAGTYTVLHKQRNPLWYAPDAYFERRHLDTPPQGDRRRYRRGALGEFAIFLNQDTPLHSGPVWLGEIGGLKLNEADLSRLYYQIETGSIVEVR